MRRRVLIGALLLVGVGVVLGATVFRTDIAQATGLAQSVTVANTPSNPVPVQQQGTASVNVTNTSLAVHDQATTQLLATGTVSDTNTSLPDIDVSGYKEVRVSASFIACNPAGGSGFLLIDAKEGGTEYTVGGTNLCQNSPNGFTQVLDVPGRTLGIRCAACTNVAIGLAVLGRAN